jgi:alpha-L-rhamnosidase
MQRISAAVTALLAAALGARAAEGAVASVRVVDLRCEYRENPLGIDVKEPRLGWKLAAVNPLARGLAQTSYRVLVASGEALLALDKGDLWDSGDVASDQSAHVVYAGKPLASGMRCVWKAQVRDQAGARSAWSAPAVFTLGLLEQSEWTADWIGTDKLFVRGQGWPPPDNTLPDPWFRKTFTLAKAPARATAYVASIGYHELYVNGRKVTDAVLAPNATNHQVRARYVTYEIAPYLHEGANAIGIWLGVSWSAFPKYAREDRPKTPMVRAQFECEDAAGTRTRIRTDATWRTHPSPSTMLGVWDFMHYGGELYDATKEVTGWCEPGLDDSSWAKPEVYAPALALSADMAEPNRLVKELRPVAIEDVEAGAFRVDMGVNFAGFVRIAVEGAPYTQVRFQFSEHPKKSMTHELHSAYVIGPSGKGVFENRFNYGVGRWIQILGLKQKPALDGIRGFLVRNDYARAGYFQCGNELLNRIYETTLWTFENLSIGSYVVDCPQRERMGYGGDAHATTETALASYALGAFYTKWAQDWRDVQGADGNLPYTAPTYWGGGGPGWSGYCVTLPWLVYRHYGDVRLLEDSLPTIRRWLAFLETKSVEHLLVRWGGEWDFLGDWLWPGAKGVNGDSEETLFFNNCYWVYNLETAAAIAARVGAREEAQDWCARAARVRDAIQRKFYLKDAKSYVNGFQAYRAMALLCDLPPAEDRAAVWKGLEDEILVARKGHFHAGITGGAFLIQTLLAAERNDLIYAMATKEDYPSLGDMLARGATTFWESWEGADLSLLHSSYLWLGAWCSEGLGGIRDDPEAPGFKQFVVKPGLVNGLPWVRARHDSLYGAIVSEWKVEEGKKVFAVAVPPNSTATFMGPGGESVTESGRPLEGAAGVAVVRVNRGETVVRLASGKYVIEVK